MLSNIAGGILSSMCMFEYLKVINYYQTGTLIKYMMYLACCFNLQTVCASLGPVINIGFCFVNLFFVNISYAKYSKN